MSRVALYRARCLMRPTRVCARESLYRTCISQRHGRGAAGELSKEVYVHNSMVFCARFRFDRLALGRA